MKQDIKHKELMLVPSIAAFMIGIWLRDVFALICAFALAIMLAAAYKYEWQQTICRLARPKKGCQR